MNPCGISVQYCPEIHFYVSINILVYSSQLFFLETILLFTHSLIQHNQPSTVDKALSIVLYIMDVQIPFVAMSLYFH